MRNWSRGLLAAALVLVLFAPACGAGASDLPTTPMEIKSKPFTVEIAATEDSRETGLMYRDAMAADHGMIFVFEKDDTYSFWMKNTRIDLDGIWLDAEGTVVFIDTMKAYTLTGHTPPEPSHYVIELNSGMAKTLGLKVGDKITIPEKVKSALKPAASQPATAPTAGTQPAK